MTTLSKCVVWRFHTIWVHWKLIQHDHDHIIVDKILELDCWQIQWNPTWGYNTLYLRYIHNNEVGSLDWGQVYVVHHSPFPNRNKSKVPMLYVASTINITHKKYNNVMLGVFSLSVTISIWKGINMWNSLSSWTWKDIQSPRMCLLVSPSHRH